MCLIAGGMGEGLKERLIQMIRAGKHRGPDAFGVWTDSGVLKSVDFSKVDEIPDGRVGLLQCRLAITGSKDFTQPFFNELVLVHNGEVYNHVLLREYLEGRGLSFETDVDSEVILRLLEYFLLKRRMGIAEALRRAMLMLDGDYAVAFFWRGRIYLFRDPVGIRPLYFSPGGFFASEKKVLWAIEERAAPVEPGELVEISQNGIRRTKILDVRELSRRSNGASEEKIVRAISNLLEHSVKMRAGKRVGVLFSGGLDSSIISLLASKYSRVTLYTAGAEGSPDLEWARRVSEELGLPLKERVFTENDVEDVIKKVAFAIEEPNFMNLAIGIPLYSATELASRDGIKVLLSGQGADELFGGYAKYLDRPGLMVRDVLEMGERNLARDDKIAMLNGVEGRYPYLSLPILGLGLGIPTAFKIRAGVRKWVLRKVGEKLGLPEEVAWREKKAAQYGSGSQKILLRIAKRKNMKPGEFAEALFKEVFGY